MNLQRFISDPVALPHDKIDSVQQGLLACATEHILFDDYQLGVNPDVSRHENYMYHVNLFPG